MAKQKKRGHQHKGGIMGRSDIPFAQRMAMQQRNNIAANREDSARIAMFCMSAAMHQLEGIGYKRLIRFHVDFMGNIREFYEDPDVGMARIKRRLAQIGIETSGEFFVAPRKEGQSLADWQIDNNRLQSSQVALFCGTVTMNDVFGFGRERLERITTRGRELSARYAEEGEGFLLEEMRQIGFPVVGGRVLAYMDEDGNPIMPGKARRSEDGN